MRHSLNIFVISEVLANRGLTMSMIFFSYRRDDSEKVAGRPFKGLKKSLGGVDVFRDLGGIEVVEKKR